MIYYLLAKNHNVLTCDRDNISAYKKEFKKKHNQDIWTEKT